MKTAPLLIASFLVVTGCATHQPMTGAPQQPESQIVELLRAHKYHEAMRALPAEMEAWANYTEQTGRTAEGAAGYLYTTTMFRVAAKGDSDWGAILDDSDIPYRYKTDMLFEIAEARLGRGSAWSSDADFIIIPQTETMNSWDEINRMLREALGEQPDGSVTQESAPSVAP